MHNPAAATNPISTAAGKPEVALTIAGATYSQLNVQFGVVNKMPYMEILTRMLHKIIHLIGWNRGNVVTATDAYGRVWIGFKCIGCGSVSGIHASYKDAPPIAEFDEGRTEIC